MNRRQFLMGSVSVAALAGIGVGATTRGSALPGTPSDLGLMPFRWVSRDHVAAEFPPVYISNVSGFEMFDDEFVAYDGDTITESSDPRWLGKSVREYVAANRTPSHT